MRYYLFIVSLLLLFYWLRKTVLKGYLDQVLVVEPITEEFGRDEIIEIPRRPEFNYNPFINSEMIIIIEEPPQFSLLHDFVPLLNLDALL